MLQKGFKAIGRKLYVLSGFGVIVMTLFLAMNASAQITVHSTGFEDGQGGWTNRGQATVATSTLQKRTGNQSLRVTGRTLNWHGAAINATSFIEIGIEYQISLWVWIDSGEAQRSIILTAQQPGVASEFLRIHDVEQANTKQWVQLSGSYTRTASVTAVTFYVESDNTTLSYFIDDVLITKPGSTVDPPPPTTTESCIVSSAVLSYDFNDYAIGHNFQTLGPATAEAKVVTDPVSSGNNVLQFKPTGGNNFVNAAPVLQFKLPEGKTLSEYTQLTFRGRFNTASGDLANKSIYVGGFQSEPSGPISINSTSTSYYLGHSSNNVTNPLGSNWRNFTINIPNSKSFTGIIYIILGMHQKGEENSQETVWHIDDVTLVGPTGNGSSSGCTTAFQGSAGWRMLSLPVGDVSVETLASQNMMQGFSGLNAFYSDHAEVNFESGVDPNFLFLSPSGWVTPSSLASTIPSGKGFVWYLWDNDLGPSVPLSDFSLEITGEVPNEDVELAIESGFNLVGNPFKSDLNLDGLSVSVGTLQDPVYVWNSADANGGGGTDYFEVLSLETDKIAPWQGMIIETNSAGTLTIPVASRTGETEATFYKNQSAERLQVRFELHGVNEAHDVQTFDRNISLLFHDLATEGWDRYDGSKMTPLSERYATLSFVGHYFGHDFMKAQESLPFHSENDMVIPMAFHAVDMGGEFTIRWDGVENLPANWSLILRDNFTGEAVYMMEEASYTFSYNENVVLAKKANSGIRIPEFRRLEADTKGKSASGDVQQGHRFSLIVSTQNPTSAPITELPQQIELLQNYPNPFNPATSIQFILPEQTQVRLSVIDMLGRTVDVLVNDSMNAGSHTVSWNASRVSSGVYIYRLEAGGEVFMRNMTLIK